LTDLVFSGIVIILIDLLSVEVICVGDILVLPVVDDVIVVDGDLLLVFCSLTIREIH